MPPLRELEEQLFQQLFQHMWSFVLMEGATADRLPGALAKQWVIPPSPEEASVQRWIDALQVRLSPASACRYYTSLHPFTGIPLKSHFRQGSYQESLPASLLCLLSLPSLLMCSVLSCRFTFLA